MFFAPPSQHGALGASGAAFGHLFGGAGGPDEAHARDAGIFIPRAGDVAAAVDDVDDAAGQADFHEDFAHELHEVGRLGGRLIDEGVARADGEGDEPAEHQRGEVEGRHAAEHAEGLFRDLAGDAPGDLIEGLALNQRGDGAGHFDDFDDALDFAAGFGNMFRLIERDALSELFQIADHAFPDFMDIGHALGDGGRGATSCRLRRRWRWRLRRFPCWETGTEPMVSPVDGLYRGTVLPPVSSCHWPLMKLRIWIMVLPPNVFWVGVGMGPFWDLGP